MLNARVVQNYTWANWLNRSEARIGAKGWNDSSILRSREEFSQTQSMEHALELARVGWPEGRAKMLSALEHEPAGDVPSLFPSVEYDLAGEYPDVGAYCAGVPEHMVSHGEQVIGKAPVVRIGVNGNVPWSIKPEAITRFGIALLSHVAAYQRAGYSVALDWLCIGAGDGDASVCVVELMAAGQTLDLDRLAFMVAHPSMLRRMWFAWVESYREPGSKGYANQFLGSGYGHPCDPDEVEGWSYPGVALPRLTEVPTSSIESAAKFLGEYIEARRT